MKKKIAILLPYKEKYTLKESAAASIWVKDYITRSKLKNITTVFGNLTKGKKPLTNNLPKSLVRICGKPFIFWQLDLLDSNGVKNILICAGYLSLLIKETVGFKYKDMKIDYSEIR